jgi:RNA polymerase sigma-70 factor (ECF subfamily)
MPGTTDDVALLAGLAAGEPSAFEELYDRYAVGLLGVARTLVGSRQDAEDAVQELFVNLVRHRQALGGVRELRPYVFTVLRRIARRRRRAAPEPLAGEVVSPAAGPVRAALARERAALLERQIAALPPAQREVLALHLDGGLTFAEIGAVTGTSPSTAASRYRYALEKLRARLR